MKGRGPLVVTYKMHYLGTTFTLKMNSNDKILCDNIVNKQHINLLKWPLKVWLESVFTYNFNFAVYLGYRNIISFPYRPSLRFQAQVPSTLHVRVYENSIRNYTIGAGSNTSECNFIFKCAFEDLERSRSTGDDLEIVLYGYIVYHED